MKILLVGAAIVDQMMWIERLPLSGEDIPCSGVRTTTGGCAFNAASTLHNMGVPFDLCINVGTGMYADKIKEGLYQLGAQSVMPDLQEDNGYCLSLIEKSGERTFITVTGAENHFSAERLSAIPMDGYDMIYVAGYQLAGDCGDILTNWLETCVGKQIFLAPGPAILLIPKERMQHLLGLHPVVHLNEKEVLDFYRVYGQEDEAAVEASTEAAQEVKTAAAFLAGKTSNTVIVTMGRDGTLFIENGKFYKVPSEKTVVKDTVGAGDSHIAGVMGCLARGYALEDAVRMANRIAAQVVGTEGPTVSWKDFQERFGGEGNE